MSATYDEELGQALEAIDAEHDARVAAIKAAILAKCDGLPLHTLPQVLAAGGLPTLITQPSQAFREAIISLLHSGLAHLTDDRVVVVRP